MMMMLILKKYDSSQQERAEPRSSGARRNSLPLGCCVRIDRPSIYLYHLLNIIICTRLTFYFPVAYTSCLLTLPLSILESRVHV